MIYNQLKFKPVEQGNYYFISFSDNEIYHQYYFGEQYRHKNNVISGNCFKTKELAEELIEKYHLQNVVELERLINNETN